MPSLYDTPAETLSRLLIHFRRKETIALCAGLLTAPEYHCALPRIDYLVHLAVLHCSGKRKPLPADLSRWLNRNLRDSEAWRIEDPAEDVFVGNVGCALGNFRIFQGIIPDNDHYVQAALTLIEEGAEGIPPIRDVLVSVYALLKVSDLVCERVGLTRWALQRSSGQAQLQIGPASGAGQRAAAVTFTLDELKQAGVALQALSPFVLAETNLDTLRNSNDTHDSVLQRHPLIRIGGEIILALPSAVGTAIRHYLYTTIGKLGLGSIVNHMASTRETELVINSLARLGGKINHRQLRTKEALPPLFSFDFEYEEGHWIHIVVLLDDVVAAAQQGDFSSARFSVSEQAAFSKLLIDTASELSTQSSFKRGTTLFVLGGLGRQRLLTVPVRELGADWDAFMLEVPQLLLLTSYSEVEFRRLLKSRTQLRWVESKGVEFFNPSGAFGHYCYWKDSEYRVIPQEFPLKHGSKLVLIGPFMASVRSKAKNIDDLHVVQNRTGEWISVTRYARDSFFAAYENVPLYASPKAAQSGILAGVAEGSVGNRWLILDSTAATPSRRSLAFYLWSNFIHLFAELALTLDSKIKDMPRHVLEVYLDISAVRDIDNEAADDLQEKPPLLMLDISTPHEGAAVIVLPANFFQAFFRFDNAAERAVIYKFGEAIYEAARTVDAMLSLEEIHHICDQVLPLGGGRMLHIFQSKNPVDSLIGNTDEKPVLVDKADMSFVRLGAGEKLALEAPRRIHGIDDCKIFLNNVVLETWLKIQALLKNINRQSLLEQGYVSIEAIFSDQKQWRISALAVLTLHGRQDAEVAAFKRDQSRARTSLCTRILMEMALCECPKEGGGSVARSEYEHLLALVAYIIEVASDSDAVHGALTLPEIVVHPNGEYFVDRSYQTTIMRPFMTNQFSEDYAAAADEYEGRHKRDAKTLSSIEPPYSKEFTDAFVAEYSISPLELVECFAELIDVAVDESTVVVATTVGRIRRQIHDNRGLSNDVINAFISHFCLSSRPAWAKAPKGFRLQDTWPWLFRRRLSIVVRPVLIDGLGDDCAAYFGISQLVQSWNYLLTRSEAGRLPQEFFASRQMRAYVGGAANARGAAFEEQTAAVLRGLGWQARTRVQLTELGGTQEQGDIDVLAWKRNGQVLAIESKWLQPARTVGEVAEVLVKFAGEEKDKLARHLARIDWLNRNTAGLRRVTGMGNDEALAVQSLLVTDADVPMMYASDLPIPVSDVTSLNRLPGLLVNRKM